MAWLRLDENARKNKKLQTIPPELFRFWFNCLCFAKSRDRSGEMRDGWLDLEDLAWDFNQMSLTKCTMMVEKLVSAVLVDKIEGRYRMHDWDSWQYKSDSSTERVRKHRETHKNVSLPVSPPVTGNSLASESVSVSVSESVKQEQPHSKSAKPKNGHDFADWFERIYANWKKYKDKHLCAQYLGECIAAGLKPEDFEKGQSAWLPYWEQRGWNFAPTLAQFVIDESWKYPPPATNGKAESAWNSV